MNRSLQGLLIGVVIGLLAVLILQPHPRLKEENNRLYEAWFVQLPGMAESFSYEHVITLRDFVNPELDEESQKVVELELEQLFRESGYATEYHIRELGSDGHWVLRREEETQKYFTLQANYRVSPWIPYKED